MTTLLGTAGIATAIPFLLLVACPIAMVLMMRGMHGHGHRAGMGDAQRPPERKSLEDLKRERDALNAEIAERAEEAADERRKLVAP